MFTKSHKWQRWSGPLTEVTAALNLAMLELQQRSGIPATVKIRISYSNQLTHSSEDPTVLEHLHGTDLRRINELWIDVELDSKWWLDQTNQYDHQQIYGDKAGEGGALLVKPPPLNYAAVTLRLSKSLTASAMFLNKREAQNVTLVAPKRVGRFGCCSCALEPMRQRLDATRKIMTQPPAPGPGPTPGVARPQPRS